MDIHDKDTVETVAPPLSRGSALLRVLITLVSLAVVVGAVSLAASPTLRRRLTPFQPKTVALSIASTPPGADVFIDDQAAGTTPTEAHVVPGPHRVRLVRRGYQAWHEVVDTASASSIAPALAPLELAALIVESEPDRARVFVDGEYEGTTPIEIENIDIGPHVVRIVKEPMYQPVTEKVELAAGETRRIVVRLESGLERLYLSRIEKDPKKLSNYTELLHLYVGNGEGDKAARVVVQAADALKSAEPEATEAGQFRTELRKLFSGEAGAVDPAAREKLVACILELFEKVAIANPGQSAAYEPFVSLLGQAGRFEDIVKVCEKTAEVPEARGRVHYYVAQMYLKWGQPDLAILLLKRAVELRPTYFHAHLALGSAYHRNEDYAEAMKEYEIAEKQAADAGAYYQADLQTQIARLLVSKKDIDGAIARYKQALEFKNPPSYTSQWRVQFAEVLVEHGHKKEAVEQYNAILKEAPETKAAYLAKRALRRLEGK